MFSEPFWGLWAQNRAESTAFPAPEREILTPLPRGYHQKGHPGSEKPSLVHPVGREETQTRIKNPGRRRAAADARVHRGRSPAPETSARTLLNGAKSIIEAKSSAGSPRAIPRCASREDGFSCLTSRGTASSRSKRRSRRAALGAQGLQMLLRPILCAGCSPYDCLMFPMSVEDAQTFTQLGSSLLYRNR